LFEKDLNEKLQMKLWTEEDTEAWKEKAKERIDELKGDFADILSEGETTWEDIKEAIHKRRFNNTNTTGA